MNFIDNSVEGVGAAVCIYSASVTMSGCFFQNNNAEDSGGAVYVQSASVTIDNSTFSGNQAGGAGNNVFCNSASINIDGQTNLGGPGTDCKSCPITRISGGTSTNVCSPASALRPTVFFFLNFLSTFLPTM